jgi:hypothetical protein
MALGVAVAAVAATCPAAAIRRIETAAAAMRSWAKPAAASGPSSAASRSLPWRAAMRAETSNRRARARAAAASTGTGGGAAAGPKARSSIQRASGDGARGGGRKRRGMEGG